MLRHIFHETWTHQWGQTSSSVSSLAEDDSPQGVVKVLLALLNEMESVHVVAKVQVGLATGGLDLVAALELVDDVPMLTLAGDIRHADLTIAVRQIQVVLTATAHDEVVGASVTNGDESPGFTIAADVGGLHFTVCVTDAGTFTLFAQVEHDDILF